MLQNNDENTVSSAIDSTDKSNPQFRLIKGYAASDLSMTNALLHGTTVLEQI